MWAFNPRTQTTGAWSNHADGKAVDLDDDQNPKLFVGNDKTFGKERRLAVSALTEIDITAKNPGAALGLDSYDASKLASDRLQKRYTAKGIQTRIDEIKAQEQPFDGRITKLEESIEALPGGKKASKQDKAQLKALKAELAAAQKQLEPIRARRKALENELKRFEAASRRITAFESTIQTLEGEIEAINAKLDPPKPAAGGGAKGDTAAAAPALSAKEKKKLKADLKTKQKSLKKAKAGIRQENTDVREWSQKGFLNLPKTVVRALTDAGLKWGGDYGGVKDFMHFELP
jgi:DNA repair exonuclease SbcCD ATPase subunit